MRYILVLILLTFLSIGCKSIKGQEECFEAYLNEVKKAPEYTLIRSAAQDTVSGWIRKDLKFFGHMDTTTNWQLDSAVFFNEDQSKALLLLLEVDKRPDAKLENVQMLAAELLDGTWHFYARSMPVIYFDRQENPNGRAHTHLELSGISRRELLRGGFYKKGTCNIDYNYVNDWFSDPLREFHRKYYWQK